MGAVHIRLRDRGESEFSSQNDFLTEYVVVHPAGDLLETLV
jgi:hypothetical protein